MTREEILAAIAAGKRPSQIAREASLPLTTVHHFAYGRGSHLRDYSTRKCSICGTPTKSLGGPQCICDRCRPAHFRAQCSAVGAVRKAVNVGMLKPARTLACVDCGGQAEHYDHRDYRKPLRVEPVCRSCNILRGVAA